MSTALSGPAAWQSDGVDPALVADLHRSVGEALTAAHVAHEEAGRGRLSPGDERALARKLLADELRRLAAGAYAEGRAPLDETTEAKVSAAVLDRIHGLARLQPLLDDPQVRDIHISGARRVWLNLRDGAKVRGPAVAESDDDLIELIATAARRLGRSERRWDHAHPELNLQLPNGDRLHALMAVSGRPTVTIRRHDFDIHRVSQLVDRGVCEDLLANFLSAAVRARANIIVAGGTGTGKTTTLRCLINEIPAEERLITVEDSLEIGLERFEALHPDHETLEAREANTEGAGAFTLAALVRSALRMDPQRVIVGEVRGAEVLPMLLAMSQGNDGSMCSIHADSSEGVFGRLAMYAAMTPERLVPDVTNLLVANALDLIEEAIVATATVAPAAIASEVRTLVRRLDHQRLPDALVAFGEDLNHPSGDLVVAALVIASRMEASDLSGLLSRLADATRGEARMRIRVEVGRTRIRTATKVILGVVVAAVVFLAIANRDYLAVYDSAGGQLMLAIVAGIFALGGWLLTRMAEIELPERFTARAAGPASVGADT